MDQEFDRTYAAIPLCALLASCSLFNPTAQFADRDADPQLDGGPRDAGLDSGADSGFDAGREDDGGVFDCSDCAWGCSTSACAIPTQIAAGGNHSCLLTDLGTVYCWGRNVTGELGDGTRVSRTMPARVIEIGDAVQITTGHSHTCARHADGTVSCWGNNAQGRLGHGMAERENEAMPVLVEGIDDAADVSAGLDATCAARATGAVDCWGNNAAGQLGSDPTTLTSSPRPVAVSGVPSAAALVSVGGAHACARLLSGAVYCWGRNLEGQTGNGGNEARVDPTELVGLTNARAISAGSTYTCALDASQRGYCWGSGTAGTLGTGRAEDANTPQEVFEPGGAPWLEIAAGNLAACGRTAAQSWSWGGGPLGSTEVSTRLSPGFIDPPLTSAADISVGSGHACAIASDGVVLCWGANADGQLGDGTTETSLAPSPVEVPGP